MMNRAYSILETKSIDEEQRIIHGVATTPSVDRIGDIVEPQGASFTLPIPFLWGHNSDHPVGHVIHADVGSRGINVQVQLAKISEPGTLKDRLDEAWQSIRAGLVRGLSIGFKSIEHERIKDSDGIRFLKWSWLELSGVTIPANADCSISLIKSIDQRSLAALGDKPTDKTTKDDIVIEADKDSRSLAARGTYSPALPVVYLNDCVEQKRRIAKPNSKVGPDGLRYSVRIIKAQ